MIKVDSTIKEETRNLAYIVLILSVLMEAGYLILGKWGFPVLLGNILGAATGLLNFFFMGIGLQKALNKDVDGAKATAKFSQTYRYLFIGAVIVASIYLICFDMVATIASIFFTSFAIYIRVIVLKKAPTSGETVETNKDEEAIIE